MLQQMFYVFLWSIMLCCTLCVSGRPLQAFENKVEFIGSRIVCMLQRSKEGFAETLTSVTVRLSSRPLQSTK